MGNKLTPRKITLAAATPTILNSLVRRSQMLVLNLTGATLGLTSDPAETTVGDCYPIADDGEFVDLSNGNIYGVSAAGGDVWVWETDI